jgi:antirestriction protein ArdC
MSEHRGDIYARITAEIVAAIEAGVDSWKMPWHHDGSAICRPINVGSRRRYRGVNVIALWIAARAAGHANGVWGTYRQWRTAGAQVRKGERGATVVLWKQISSTNEVGERDDEDPARARIVARAFSVFNIAQVDGYQARSVTPVPKTERFAHADAFIDALGIPVTFGAYDAHYRIDLDHIFMPPCGSFHEAAEYYGTHLHEAAHATGAKHRLDRSFNQRFGRDALAIEEAIAELTASFVLADLSIAHHPRPDHAAYIASWLRVLKHDPRAIFTAASKAQAAADWMQAQQPGADAGGS